MSASPHAFAYGHAQSPDWDKAAEQCLQQLGYIDPAANLGFLYVSDTFADLLPGLLAHFRAETGVAHWVGGVGMGICATGKEYYQTGAVVAMVASLPEEGFRILPLQTDPALPGLAALEDWLDPRGDYLALLHADPANADIAGLIEALGERLPRVHLVGGLSSARGRDYQIADQVVCSGISGVVIDLARVPMVTGLSQGVSPLGPAHQITACERNIVAGLDGRPALDVFFEDIGEILARDLNRTVGYIFAGLPRPGAERGGGSGDYLVRHLVGVDTRNRLLAVAELLSPGQELMFCRRDGPSAWADLDRMLADLRARLSGPPRGAIYISCVGRGMNLFGGDSDELRAIRQGLGDVPLVGFYASGEISGGHLYGYTGVLAVFC